jgi:PRC-barrel domain
MSTSPDPRAKSILVEELADWRSQDVVDEKGDKLGKLDDVLYDGESDHPAFAAVRSGTLSKHLTYVPLVGASVGRDYVHVRFTKGALKDAPTFDTELQLTADDEGAIYDFFGMGYAPTAQGGRRLARR